MKNSAASFILSFILIISCNLYATENPYTNAKLNIFSGTLSGRVTDKSNGHAIAGATVYINDLKVGAVTDTSGNYFFRKLPSGSFLVEARSVSYKASTQNITINGSVVLDFKLTVNIVEESEVVVTGLSKATQIRRSPIPIVSVNHAALTSNLNTNIIDALTRVPGVTAVTTGPNVSKPYIRGLGYNRILTLYDGIRQEGQQWGDEHGIEVDQFSIDRVEIVKGPSSLSYGSDAVAGVVNLIPTQPAPEGKMIGDIMGEYYTNNRQFAGSAMLSGTKNGFEWLGRISHKQATNYQNNADGRVYGTGFKETDATAYLGVHGNWGFSHLSFSMFNNQLEIPDGSRDSATGMFTKQITEADDFRPIVPDAELTTYKIADLHQHVQHYRFFSNNSYSIGQSRFTLNLAYQKSIRQEFNHPEMSGIAGLWLDLNTYNYDVKYFAPEFNGWNVTLGVNGMYQKNNVTKGTDFLIPSFHQFDIGPFAQIKKTFDKLDIAGGIRYDSRSFTNDQLYTKPDPVTGFDKPYYGPVTAQDTAIFSNYHHIFAGASGSLGFTYNATEQLSFKANIARGFRAPNIAEISSNGAHPGTNIYQIGNPNFKPEFNWQEDIGLTYASKYLVLNLSIFYNSIQNFIFNQRLLGTNGSDSVLLSGFQTFKFLQGKAALYGGEINIDIHPTPKLHFENSLSIVYGSNKASGIIKIQEDNKYIPFIPPFHGLSELRYDFTSDRTNSNKGYIKAQLVYYAAQNRVYTADNTETTTPGYNLFNIGIGKSFMNKTGKSIMNVSVMANNLFNVSYYNHLSRLKYFISPNDPDQTHGIHDIGRNIALRLDIPLNFELK
ncbi:MAG: TonB-dependent receptor [Chitinophagaceae bacterium]